MKRLLFATALCISGNAIAADPPVAEKYKHAGSAALFAGYYDTLLPRCGLRGLDWAVSLTAHAEDEIRTFPGTAAAGMFRAFDSGQQNGVNDFAMSGNAACAAVRVSDLQWADSISDGTGKLVPGYHR